MLAMLGQDNFLDFSRHNYVLFDDLLITFALFKKHFKYVSFTNNALCVDYYDTPSTALYNLVFYRNTRLTRTVDRFVKFRT